VGSPQVYLNEDRYQPTGEIIERSSGLSVVTSILDEMEDEDDALMVQEDTNGSEAVDTEGECLCNRSPTTIANIPYSNMYICLISHDTLKC